MPFATSFEVKTRLILRTAVGLLVWLSGPRMAFAEFIPLGDLPGGNFLSQAFAVSADGTTVVGFSSSAASEPLEAFRWTQATGMVGLGFLPGGPTGDFGSWAFGVSADGSVVVGVSSSALGNQAFRWMEAGGMVGLGFLPGGAPFSEARGVSADGSVVVGVASLNPEGFEAFRWTAATGMVGLAGRPGDEFASSALAVSADGAVVVGVSRLGGLDAQAFRWTEATGIVGLSGALGRSGEATAVSADGSVVVGSFEDFVHTEAFRWTEAEGMVGLGVLEFISFATGVSADGSVIVGVSGSGSFVWDSMNGMRDLQGVLISQGDDLTGWSFLGAQGVSADGTTIVGTGRNPDGQTEAWLARLQATPIPEPPSVVLLVAAAASLFGYAQLRRQRDGSGPPGSRLGR